MWRSLPGTFFSIIFQRKARRASSFFLEGEHTLSEPKYEFVPHTEMAVVRPRLYNGNRKRFYLECRISKAHIVINGTDLVRAHPDHLIRLSKGCPIPHALFCEHDSESLTVYRGEISIGRRFIPILIALDPQYDEQLADVRPRFTPELIKQISRWRHLVHPERRIRINVGRKRLRHPKPRLRG